MFAIDEIKIENTSAAVVTDNEEPVLSFSLRSDKEGCRLESGIVRIGNWKKRINAQTGIVLKGLKFQPFTTYTVKLTAFDNYGNQAEKSVSFSTGRLQTPWSAKWITDKSYGFKRGTSPAPFTFRRSFKLQKPVRRAFITATALGIYELELNGKKVGNEYFAPGFTSYKHDLQYNFYDVRELLGESNTLIAVVGGGWAAGRFTYASKSKITCDRPAFKMELFLEYADGTKEKLTTDTAWQVTQEGNFRFGDFYDGEIYDATVDLEKVHWKSADTYQPGFEPNITARYGCAVTKHETLNPVASFPAKNGKETIYDFGQNFAGVIKLKINGTKGQKIVVRHAEILLDGNLCVKSLRTAKATTVYICADGIQEYSPRLTYMGFRYIGISGIVAEKVQVGAIVLHSDFEEIGTFECSNPMLNQLQNNIRWSGKSNFLDIPTDCPQRDERQGWTGDISVYASTACFNFDLSRFFDKWLRDVRSEQSRTGGIPQVVPKQGYGAPAVPTACWGDCCILVPWAEYLARGNKELLKKQYPCMKKYLSAVKFWAGLFSINKNKKHIWKWLFQFGDWCAPEGNIMDWMAKGKWVATAYYANSCNIVSKIAEILGEKEDALYYHNLYKHISNAYRSVFTDQNGNLKNEFQTGYVLPLYFNMASSNEAKKMAENLNRLVAEKDYHLSTGFTGTPYLLFALADNGYADTAYKLLLQDTSPSWLHCIKKGATTTWEEWDIDPSKSNKDGNIPSYNHYAYGAVGDFLYRRVLGIEADEGGYKSFTVKPILGGGLTYARGETKTPFGKIGVQWEIKGGGFGIDVRVPVSASCTLVLPSGKTHLLNSGAYHFEEAY